MRCIYTFNDQEQFIDFFNWVSEDRMLVKRTYIYITLNNNSQKQISYCNVCSYVNYMQYNCVILTSAYTIVWVDNLFMWISYFKYEYVAI